MQFNHWCWRRKIGRGGGIYINLIKSNIEFGVIIKTLFKVYFVSHGNINDIFVDFFLYRNQFQYYAADARWHSVESKLQLHYIFLFNYLLLLSFICCWILLCVWLFYVILWEFYCTRWTNIDGLYLWTKQCFIPEPELITPLVH